MKHKGNYVTLRDALADLQKRGYTSDFNLKYDHLECPRTRMQLKPEDFKVDEYYRFEGMSAPEDNSVVYAISGKDGTKGTLVDAYGMYADSLTREMILRLKVDHS